MVPAQAVPAERAERARVTTPAQAVCLQQTCLLYRARARRLENLELLLEVLLPLRPVSLVPAITTRTEALPLRLGRVAVPVAHHQPRLQVPLILRLCRCQWKHWHLPGRRRWRSCQCHHQVKFNLSAKRHSLSRRPSPSHNRVTALLPIPAASRRRLPIKLGVRQTRLLVLRTPRHWHCCCLSQH